MCECVRRIHTLREPPCPLGLCMCFLALGGLVLVVFLSWGASSAARSLDRVTAAIKRNPEAGKAAVEKVAQRLTAVNGGLERFADWLTEVGNRKL